MLQRAAPYAILCRVHGCFFIHNFRGNSLRNAKVNWKTPYTIYSLSFFGLYLILEEMYATRFAYVIRNISDTLSKYLLLVIYGVVMVKIITNLAVMLAKPDKLLAFFLKSEVFETNTGFSPRSYSLQHSTFHRWNAVRAIWVFMAFVLFFTEAERFMIAELTRSMPPQKSVPLTIFGFIMGSGFMVYDSLSYLFLRCCTKVLVEYIHVEVQGFQEPGKLQNIHFHSQSPREIEATRLRVNNIRKLKESFNEIWEGPLILACASTIMVNCVVLDAMFHDGMRKELWLAVAYSLYSSLCFIDLAYTGQSLIDEVSQCAAQDLTTLKSY